MAKTDWMKAKEKDYANALNVWEMQMAWEAAARAAQAQRDSKPDGFFGGGTSFFNNPMGSLGKNWDMSWAKGGGSGGTTGKGGY
jgi:hypothetical protein